MAQWPYHLPFYQEVAALIVASSNLTQQSQYLSGFIRENNVKINELIWNTQMASVKQRPEKVSAAL